MSGKSIICKGLLLLAALAAGLVCVSFVGAASYADDEVIGTLTSPLYATSGDTLADLRSSTVMSSDLGEATADAAAAATGADFGFLCGGEMWSNLQAGPITWGALVSAYTENRTLAVAEVTPAQLKSLLESAVSKLVVDLNTELIDRDASSAEAFPQLSGLKIQVDLSAPVGERILKIQLIGGGTLDLRDTVTVYTLAATDFMLSGGYDMPELPHESCAITMAEAMAHYIQGGSIDVSGTRVTFVGGNEDTLYSKVPDGLVYGIIAMILVCQFYRKKKPRSPDDRSVDW